MKMRTLIAMMAVVGIALFGAGCSGGGDAEKADGDKAAPATHETAETTAAPDTAEKAEETPAAGNSVRRVVRTLERLTDQFCDAAVQGEISRALEMTQPRMLEDYLEVLSISAGSQITLYNISKVLGPPDGENPIASCEVSNIKKYECPDDRKEYQPVSDKPVSVHDQCATADITMTTKDGETMTQPIEMVTLEDETGDWKDWYLDMSREIKEELSVGGPQNSLQFAMEICDTIGDDMAGLGYIYNIDFGSLVMVGLGMAADHSAGLDAFYELLDERYSADEKISHCEVVKKKVVDCEEAMADVAARGLGIITDEPVPVQVAIDALNSMDIPYCATVQISYDTDKGPFAALLTFGYFAEWSIMGYEPL